MKRYLITILFSLAIILIYHIIDVNFFSYDLNQRITNQLFTTFNKGTGIDETIVLINSGKLSNEEIKQKVDTLLNFNPKAIGISINNIRENEKRLFDSLSHIEKIAINYTDKNLNSSSIVVNRNNVVTHFKSIQSLSL
jgi:hypothetical protein